MRECGYDIPAPQISVNHYNEIFEIANYEKLTNYTVNTYEIPRDYQLIEVIYTYNPHYRMSAEEFIKRKEEGRSIRTGSPTIWYVYKIPSEKFSRIEQKLLTLDVLKETETVSRWFPDFTYKPKPSFWQTLPPSSYIKMPYESWYYVPPRYKRFKKHTGSSETHRVGFGFRYDQYFSSRVIDINLDSDTVSGYRFFTLVKGD